MAKKKVSPGPVQDIQHEEVHPSTPAESAPLFDESGKEVSKDLTLVSKTSALSMYNASSAELAKLKQILATTKIAGVDDKDNYKIIFDAHQVAKNTITQIEKTRLALKRQATAMIDGVAAELDKDWSAVETQLAAARKPVDDELNRIKNEKAEAHKKMVEERITFLTTHGFNFDGKIYRFEFGVTKLEASLEEVNTYSVDDWNVFAVVAEQRYTDKVAYDKDIADQAAKAKSLQEENDRLKAQLAALQSAQATPAPAPKEDTFLKAPQHDFHPDDVKREDPLDFLKPSSGVSGPPESGTVVFTKPTAAPQFQATHAAAAEAHEVSDSTVIEVTLPDEDMEYLDMLVEAEAAADRSEAISYCIKSCVGIEKLYGGEAYVHSENDLRKPYIEALQQIHAGKAPKGKAFAEWARGIAQTVLHPQS